LKVITFEAMADYLKSIDKLPLLNQWQFGNGRNGFENQSYVLFIEPILETAKPYQAQKKDNK